MPFHQSASDLSIVVSADSSSFSEYPDENIQMKKVASMIPVQKHLPQGKGFDPDNISMCSNGLIEHGSNVNFFIDTNSLEPFETLVHKMVEKKQKFANDRVATSVNGEVPSESAMLSVEMARKIKIYSFLQGHFVFKVSSSN